MDQIYPVTLDGIKVGQATVETQGLYYRISCRCKLPRKEIYTLCTDGEDLGILVPDGEQFCLVTRVPQKRFPQKTFLFCLLAKNDKLKTKWIPISNGEPFDYLHRLKDARFSVTEQGPAIGLPTTVSRP